jgi:hypothetical protein
MFENSFINHLKSKVTLTKKLLPHPFLFKFTYKYTRNKQTNLDKTYLENI